MTIDREYFESDNQDIGYRGEGYRDFSENVVSAQLILGKNPESVIDFGGARGYIVKKILANGVEKAAVMDNSPHCYHTRVVDSFIQWDLTDIPYPLEDKEFDLAFSNSVLEHIPEDKIDSVIIEMARVTKRGFHGICSDGLHGNRETFDQDGTHETFKPISWWQEKFDALVPGYEVEISPDLMQLITADNPLVIPGTEILKDGRTLKKINLGSFIGMFHYGWINLDLLELVSFADKNHYYFMKHDIRRGLPFPDGYADLVFSSHTWEHLHKPEGAAVMKEVYRILRNGGVFRVAVPNSRYMIEKYLTAETKEWEHFSAAVTRDTLPIEDLAAILLDNHHYIYDENNMEKIMREAGFTDITVTTPFKSQDFTMETQTIISHPTVSLVMEGKK